MIEAKAPATVRDVARVYFPHRSTLTSVALTLLVVAARASLGPVGRADVLAFGAMVCAWPLIEWALHVALHLPALEIDGRRFELFLAREHRLHHREPGIPDHTLFPPLGLVLFSVVFTGAAAALLGPRGGLSAALAFHLGGLLNGWVHLVIHSAVPARTRYFRRVRRIHLLHHFRDARRGFAFTGPWVDALMGTKTKLSS
jgi:dihydroceramide fatty acyl 2-hydroxylase